MKILAIDIGGTSSRFASFYQTDGVLEKEASIWLTTTDYSSFRELIEDFLTKDFSCSLKDADTIVIAAAGPVKDGVYCSPPNIEWEIDLSKTKKDLSLNNIFLVNDFVAQSYACVTKIGVEAKPVIRPKTIVSNGLVKGVIGAGTGLGKGIIVNTEKGWYQALPSEGGHGTFAAELPEEVEYVKFVLRQTGTDYVTWEDVVSGPGLSYLHEFLTGEKSEPAQVGNQLSQNNNLLSWAARFYGRACRNFSLEVLPYGGLYITGGVAAKNPELVENDYFKETFLNSATHKFVLEQIPVFLMNNEESGLWGAAHVGFEEWKKQ